MDGRKICPNYLHNEGECGYRLHSSFRGKDVSTLPNLFFLQWWEKQTWWIENLYLLDHTVAVGAQFTAPILSSEIQTCFTIQLTILSTGGARHPVLRCLFAPHRQHRCHHPSNSRLASRLLPPSSLVQQAWWGYRSASFWDMKCSIWQWEPQAEKQEAIKVLKGFQAPQGNNAIPYLALNPLVRLSLPHFPIRKAPALFQLYLLSL